MKRQWLSLKRRSNEVQGTCNDPIEISDDESFDLSPNVKKSSKESIDVTSHGAANVPNGMIDAFKCNLKHVNDIADDLSNDKDIVIDDDASDNVFNQSQSMFKWNKPIFAPAVPSSSYSFPENSGLRKVMPIEASNKRQKIMNGSTSYDDLSSSDDELTNLGIFKKDDLPPQVEIQHKVIEIAGVKVKFPVEPYPCQKSVMNSVSKCYDCVIQLMSLYHSFINYIENCMCSSLMDVIRSRTVSWKVPLAVVRLWHFSVELWHGKKSTVVSL